MGHKLHDLLSTMETWKEGKLHKYREEKGNKHTECVRERDKNNMHTRDKEVRETE